MIRPLSIEVCCCMGGMAEGFRRAGVTFDIAVDKDPAAVESYEANHGHRPIQMDVHDLIRLARLGAFAPQVDLLVADPPCTPWSMAGDRKGLEDERDLLREVVELLNLLRPTRWLIGNVPGLDKGDNWRDVVLPVIYAPMEAAGYHVDYISLDAADFGVPQRRIRPFWFGHAADEPCIRWPVPTHAPPPVLPGVGLRPWVSCGEALSEAFGPRETWGPEVGRRVRMRRRWANSLQHGSVTDRPARTVGTSNLSDGNVIDEATEAERKLRKAGRKPRASTPDEPAHTVTTRENGDGNVLNAKHPPSEIDEPSRTVCAKHRGGAQGAMAILTHDVHHPPMREDLPANGGATRAMRDELTQPGHHDPNVSGSGNSGILLSERALLVLQGFPLDWTVAGRTKTARMSQIGQAMPPKLAEVVALAVVDQARRARGEPAAAAPPTTTPPALRAAAPAGPVRLDPETLREVVEEGLDFRRDVEGRARVRRG